MGAVRNLAGLAFSSSIGLIFLILGCALPELNTFWPLFNLFFYFLAPLPILFARSVSSGEEGSQVIDWCYFITTGIVISAFALPLVMLRVNVIKDLAFGLVTVGNIFIFITIWGFLTIFNDEDDWGGY